MPGAEKRVHILKDKDCDDQEYIQEQVDAMDDANSQTHGQRHSPEIQYDPLPINTVHTVRIKICKSIQNE